MLKFYNEFPSNHEITYQFLIISYDSTLLCNFGVFERRCNFVNLIILILLIYSNIQKIITPSTVNKFYNKLVNA